MSSIPSSTPTDPRARFWGNLAKWSFLIVGCAVLAPVFWLALGGLIGLVAFVVVAGATWMLRPWAYSVAANTRLRLIKREAAKNPVDTLQEEHRRQTVALNDRKAGIETLAGAIKTLDQTIDQLQSEFPDSPELPQLRADQRELEDLLASRNQDWQDAYVTLGEFAKEIKRADRLWQVSLAAARARGASGLTEGEWMSQLKTQTSFDSIRAQLNSQLAALSTEKMQADADRALKGRIAQKALPAAQPAIEVATTTRARAAR